MPGKTWEATSVVKENWCREARDASQGQLWWREHHIQASYLERKLLPVSSPHPPPYEEESSLHPGPQEGKTNRGILKDKWTFLRIRVACGDGSAFQSQRNVKQEAASCFLTT